MNANYHKIVTTSHPNCDVLYNQCEELPKSPEGIAEGKRIVEQLMEAAHPILPIAGLAAPQIGIAKRVAIFTWNRDPKNLMGIINPQYFPIDENHLEEAWEGCLSTVLIPNSVTIAKVPRYAEVIANFLDINGIPRRMHLKHHTARIFQHEVDHLNGIVNTRLPAAISKQFSSEGEMIDFIKKERELQPVFCVEPVELPSMR